jgi:hypothetical protein
MTSLPLWKSLSWTCTSEYEDSLLGTPAEFDMIGSFCKRDDNVKLDTYESSGDLSAFRGDE